MTMVFVSGWQTKRQMDVEEVLGRERAGLVKVGGGIGWNLGGGERGTRAIIKDSKRSTLA